MTYAEKLKDPRWQRKRLEIMKRDGFMCQNCSETTKTLNVDHKVYRRGFEPWDYTNDDLQTLCEDCHKLVSDGRQALNEAIGELSVKELTAIGRIILHMRNNVIFLYNCSVITIPPEEWVRTMEFLEATKKFVSEQYQLKHAMD